MNSVMIENVGPIHQLTIPVPEGGGVVVLTGDNGVGKSEALKATKTLLSGNGSLTKRDGVLANGIVQGFGATIRVAARTSHTGELQVVSLEDRLNVADLVDPKIQNPAAADAKRIKAILALTGVKPDLSKFAGLIPDLASYVSAAAKTSTDIVEMAATIKRDLEAAARDKESQATGNEGAANAIRAAVAGVDFTAECDAVILSKSHVGAMKRQAELGAKWDAATKAKQLVITEAEKLDKAIANYSGSSVEDATIALSSANDKFNCSAKRYRAAGTELDEARAENNHASDSLQKAKAFLDDAKKHASFIASIKALIFADPIFEPSEDELFAADAEVESASTAMQDGALVRDAKSKLETIDRHEATGKQNRTKAAALRTACTGVDGILSQAVACKSLKVVDGRLVTETDARGPTYYQELSDGQRWKIALDIAIDAVGECGVLVIPQPAWEGLSPKSRNMIGEHVKGKRVTVITAQSADGALRAEEWVA